MADLTAVFYAIYGRETTAIVEISIVIMLRWSRSNLEIEKMVDWQITAATFRCETVNEEITLLVNKDWTVKCTSYMKRAGKKNSIIPDVPARNVSWR